MNRNKMKKPIAKRAVDFLMTAALPLLMPYSLIGEAAHEWIGMGMFLLFAAHLVLNRKWIGSLGKGRWPAYRTVQTVIVALCFLTMVGLMASGTILSNHLFSGLHIRGQNAPARQVHMAGSFWGFVFMSLHLGLHWGMVLNALRQPAGIQAWILRVLGWLTAAYGAYAFFKRGFPDYLLLQTHFLFLDYEEPILFFFLDYLTIMGLFIFCAHYGGRLLHRKKTILKKDD